MKPRELQVAHHPITFLQAPPEVVVDPWDRPVPLGILLWALDGQVRPKAPTELVTHSTLSHSAAVHAAYANLATAHFAHAMARQQRAIEGAQLDGPDRAAHITPPSGWVPRLKFFVTCCTNTSSASSTILAVAEVFMPIKPGERLCYVMPAGACARVRLRVPGLPVRAHWHVRGPARLRLLARACPCACGRLRACARAYACLCVCVRACHPCACARAEACAYAGTRGSAALALNARLPSFLLGVGGWAPDHEARNVGVRLAHEAGPIIVAREDSHHSLVTTIDGQPGFPRADAARPLADWRNGTFGPPERKVEYPLKKTIWS